MIVFDLDGTLTDISPAAARIASIGDKWELPLSSLAHWVLRTGNRAYRSLGYEFRAVNEVRDTLRETLGHEQNDTFFLLMAAAAKNVKCSILSNGPGQWGRNLLARHNLDVFFDKAVFRDGNEYLKPDPRALRPVLDDAALEAGKDIWVFGDRESDAMLAIHGQFHTHHRLVPVAISGTYAARTIERTKASGVLAAGHVFESHHHMACALNPDVEYNLAKASKIPFAPYHRIDSPRLS